MILREADRRRKTELIKIKTAVIINSPIKAEAKMDMSMDLMEEAYSKLAPWAQDTRTTEEIEKTQDQQLEDFYYRNIEAYRKQKALIEEMESGRE